MKLALSAKYASSHPAVRDQLSTPCLITEPLKLVIWLALVVHLSYVLCHHPPPFLLHLQTLQVKAEERGRLRVLSDGLSWMCSQSCCCSAVSYINVHWKAPPDILETGTSSPVMLNSKEDLGHNFSWSHPLWRFLGPLGTSWGCALEDSPLDFNLSYRNPV